MEITVDCCQIFDNFTCFLAFVHYHRLLSDLVRAVVWYHLPDTLLQG